MTNAKGGGVVPKPIKQTFEVVNKATGGMAGDVADSLKDAGKDMARDVAQAPMDVLKGLLAGGVPRDKADGDTGIEDMGATSGAGSTTGPDPDDPVYRKMKEAKEKKEAALRQARAMIAQYEQQWEKTKQEEEQRKQVEEQQEEQEKVQIKQLQEQKKQEALVLQQAKAAKGSGEMIRKKH